MDTIHWIAFRDGLMGWFNGMAIQWPLGVWLDAQIVCRIRGTSAKDLDRFKNLNSWPVDSTELKFACRTALRKLRTSSWAIQK